MSFLPDDELWQYPDFESECLGPFREANPDLVGEVEKVPPDVDQAASEAAWVGPIRRACFDTIFFAAVAGRSAPI